ncbi:MAG: TolB family protein [Thermotogota bacterium]
MIIEYDSSDWFHNQMVENIVEIGSYFYNFELISSNKTEYLATYYDYNKEMSYDSDVFLRLTNSSTEIINVYYEIEGKNNLKKIKSKNSADWITEMSVDILEKISLSRFKHDSSWKTLQLTFYDGVDEYPIKRNDTIAFISDRFKGNREVYYYDLKNNSTEKISLELSSEYFPDISPDGNFFVFQSTLFGNWDIVLYDKQKNDFLKVTENYYGYSPYFKDESTIVFSEEVDDVEEYNRIVEYNLKTMTKKILVEDNLLKYRPSYYKDNLIYYGIDPHTAEVKIYIKNEEESKNIFDLSRNQMDSWSDNSDKIVFSYNFNASYDIFYYYNNNLLNLTRDIKVDTYYPTFSDDGKYVFFSVYFKDKEPDIFIKKLF